MQSTLLLSGLALFGFGLTCTLLRRGKSRTKSFASRMPIELDFDAAKTREQNRH
ncbi:hypothetical protein [Paucidesulfovibrio longus]|jgi:hypothetical protein|uniref:hypothetical protein n=1 Tax=Paucidesulfovibrio longus TaxID=889 RepID=UPI0003B70112|nr:hypothetical protein [Paucidesulfovibrio longus]